MWNDIIIYSYLAYNEIGTRREILKKKKKKEC